LVKTDRQETTQQKRRLLSEWQLVYYYFQKWMREGVFKETLRSNKVTEFKPLSKRWFVERSFTL
jgi:hypothetical protein